ncbi:MULTISPECIES: hypothetical protein [unclassified Streptomyces]|uniref:hypothetical protein n=1 Tax=unclassified Streptomyces TaxID=2593676 RepID=UPI002782B1AF|nr:hypothetical protein [Streptomyces sp. B4I13]MDQ0957702.1 hypothetical protein [Streptomyces sp. B4I13]
MGVSRRALLGYSSSAAAGAVLTSAGPARAEEADVSDGTAAARQGGVTEQASDSDTEWGGSTQFRGTTTPPSPEDEGYIVMTFSIDQMPSPTMQKVTALDVAEAVNELLASRGWPAIKFYGNVPKALN